MAYVKILTIKCNNSYFKNAVDYAINPEKTIYERLQSAEKYIVNPEKTTLDEVRYADCINLTSLESASAEMIDTKNKYEKTNGRLGYHVIQSFSPDDKVTAKQAHEIGMQYAREIFGDYEVVVGTHVDRHHIHNHIVINSVSMTGEKLHMEKGFIKNTLWEVSNRYSKEHGLSVIPMNSVKDMPKTLWMDRHFQPGSFKESINHDIRQACRVSSDIPGMIIALENMGYVVDASNKYITLRPVDGNRNWRLSGFYSDSELQKMMSQEGHEILRPKYLKKTYKGAKPRFIKRKLSQYQYMYLKWCRLLNIGKKGYYSPMVSREDKLHCADHIEELSFIAKNNISSIEDVAYLKEQLTDQKKRLYKEKSRLRRRKKNFAALFDAHKYIEKYSVLINSFSQDVPSDILVFYNDAIELVNKSGMTAERIHRERVAIEQGFLDIQKREEPVREKLKLCNRILVSDPGMKKAVEKERMAPRSEKEKNIDKQKQTELLGSL